MSVFSGFPCTKESVGEGEDGEFWLGCLLEEDARNLEAGPGRSCRVESRVSSSLACAPAGAVPDDAQQAPLSCLSSDGYPKGGKSRPQRFPGSSVPEAWIPISERYTEILGRFEEGEKEGKVVTRRRKADQE